MESPTTEEVIEDVTADPSPAPEDAPAESSAAPEDVSAESSPAEEVEDKETLMEAVKKAVEPEETEESTEEVEAEPEAELDAKSDEADPEAEATELDDELPEGLSEKANQSFAKMRRERDEYKRDAEQFGKVQEYLDANNLTADDASEALQFAAMMKGVASGRISPADAMKTLKPLYDGVASLTGEHLPEDIQQRLEEGYIDETAAKELAEARQAQVMAQRQQEFSQQQAEQDRIKQTRIQISGAVNDWETKIRGRDPDYDLKATAVKDRATVLRMEQGIPSTPEEALKLVETAYDDVSKLFARANPRPRPVTPSPNSQSRASAAGAAEPASLLDAAKQALANM